MEQEAKRILSGTYEPPTMLYLVAESRGPCISIYTHTPYLGYKLSFLHILGVLGNWGRLCPFDMIFGANGSVFRAEHAPLLRTAYFLSRTRVLRVRKRGSTLN